MMMSEEWRSYFVNPEEVVWSAVEI